MRMNVRFKLALIPASLLLVLLTSRGQANNPSALAGQAASLTNGFAPENAASGAKASPSARSSTAKRRPYNPEGKPWPIPGTVEAENFDEGTAADPAYYDDSPGSSASADEFYRKSDVDLGVDPLENLVDVGWVNVGEWLEYTVDVKTTGDYTIRVRIATPKPGKSLHFDFNGKNVTGSVPVPQTGCWGSDLHGHDCFQEAVARHVRLTKGVERMRFVPEGYPDQKDLFTVDKFRFELEKASR